MERTGQSLFRTVFGMMMSPSATIRDAVRSTHPAFSLGVSSLAFGLFFLQTGLDLYRVGQKGMTFVVFSLVAGLLYGVVIIPLIGLIGYGMLKTVKTEWTLSSAVSSFCLSYSSALVYGAIGLVFSLALGWRTAVAFGVSGVLWAIGPLILSVREMTDNDLRISILLVTLFSSVVLLSWSVFSGL